MISHLSRKMIGIESCVFPQTSVDKMVEMQTRIAMRKRKTRRGKKKSVEKFPMKSSGDSCEIDCVYSSCQHCMKESICGQKNTNLSKEMRRGRSRQILRPRYSPKAPHNSTQFIMDGYLKDQSFYDHFDSPEYPCDSPKILPELEYSPNNSRSSDYGLDTLFRDSEVIDFGVATKDTVAFMEQDFETAMRTAQMDELSNMPKEELLNRVLFMADRAEQLEKELEQSSSDSSHLGEDEDDPMIESNANGQRYLSKLYRENVQLKSENQQLKEMLSKLQN